MRERRNLLPVLIIATASLLPVPAGAQSPSQPCAAGDADCLALNMNSRAGNTGTSLGKGLNQSVEPGGLGNFNRNDVPLSTSVPPRRDGTDRGS